MSDMSAVIIPKSDQLNADDLITGPRTITITGVTIRGGGEQPISVSFDGDNGKPYKPCKSMCRVMVTAWGADSKQYTGRSMTLYRDPAVTWAGMAVGGIRITHMTHIESPITMALTMTKKSRAPYTVKPLVSAPAVTGADDQQFVTAEQAQELQTLCEARGIVDKFLAKGEIAKFAHLLAGDYAAAKKLIEKQPLKTTEQ